MAPRWVIARLLLGAVLAIASTGPVLAQTTTGNAATDAVVKAGSQILVDEAEQAAGRIFTKEQVRLIRDVLGAAAGTNTQRTRRQDGDGADDTTAKFKSGKGKGAKKGNKGKSKNLPPGLAKKDKLPPGLQKQVEKGGSLPPGLAKRRLPSDLEARLGDPTIGTERVIVDTDVVLIEKGTEIVLDVIKGVLSGKPTQ